MSDKERVLARWPDAYSERNRYMNVDAEWLIWDYKSWVRQRTIGIGRTEESAWADAARNLERNK